ncbi:methyl-accepting chemotaxis protein [Paenibacillus terrigena]|uniref:methyl-accepting chemotaxis protein n=1 Tax=Paenibacillus terrigena TaxID=369333 RepID=UPI0028D2AB4C|nr:methyl-accepting chemotaxis protein [Paenibacillus terrigena]
MSKALMIHKFITVPSVISPNQPCREVVQMIHRGIDSECLVVCHEITNEPVGLVMKDRFFRFLGKKYGADLYYEKPITQIMDPNPLIVDIHIRPQEMIDMALNREEKHMYDCVIVTNQGQFIGVLTVGVLLHIARMQQQQSIQDQLGIAHRMEERIEQIHASVEEVASAADQGMMQSEEMVHLTLQGKSELDKVSLLFNNFALQAERQERQIDELQQKTSSVSEISHFIREIAEKSNLLAVNAAIEAARAGEHGKGFSVVAVEVRKLADETKRSALAITEMIEQIALAVTSTVRDVQSGREETANSAMLVTGAKDLFERLSHAAEENRLQASDIRHQSVIADKKTSEVTRSLAQIVEQLQKTS